MNTLYEEGLLGLGATRGARKLALPGQVLLNLVVPLTSSALTAQYSPLTGAYVPTFTVVPDPLGPFPYGFPVENP